MKLHTKNTYFLFVGYPFSWDFLSSFKYRFQNYEILDISKVGRNKLRKKKNYKSFFSWSYCHFEVFNELSLQNWYNNSTKCIYRVLKFRKATLHNFQVTNRQRVSWLGQFTWKINFGILIRIFSCMKKFLKHIFKRLARRFQTPIIEGIPAPVSPAIYFSQ